MRTHGLFCQKMQRGGRRRRLFLLFSGDDLFGDCATAIRPSVLASDGRGRRDGRTTRRTTTDYFAAALRISKTPHSSLLRMLPPLRGPRTRPPRRPPMA